MTSPSQDEEDMLVIFEITKEMYITERLRGNNPQIIEFAHSFMLEIEKACKEFEGKRKKII